MIVPIAIPALTALLFGSLPIHGRDPVESALARFLSTDPLTFKRKLSEVRPAPIDAGEKAAAVRSFYEALPESGEITAFNDASRRKMAALERVLRVHDRGAAYDIKVITTQQAYVGLYERAIILVSEVALNMLETEELQAMVAHEMAHEYVWERWQAARETSDHTVLKELELYCDGIAMTTLQVIGVRPSRFYGGVRKISRFNRERFGKATNDDSYPSLDEREKFAKAVSLWLANTALK
jgi:hypothetical protein